MQNRDAALPEDFLFIHGSLIATIQNIQSALPISIPFKISNSASSLMPGKLTVNRLLNINTVYNTKILTGIL